MESFKKNGFLYQDIDSLSNKELQEIAGGKAAPWVTIAAGVALCGLAVAVEIGTCAVGTLAAGEIAAAGVGLIGLGAKGL